MVEQTLAGRGDRLKAYELAVAVLERDASFNPQSDPIIRIEMAHLRRDLEHYYLTDGRADPIRITIPKGHYVPAFEVRERPPGSMAGRCFPRWLLRGHGCRAWLWPPACASSLWSPLLAIWAPWRGSGAVQQAGPAVIVLPFQSLSGGEGGQLLATD